MADPLRVKIYTISLHGPSLFGANSQQSTSSPASRAVPGLRTRLAKFSGVNSPALAAAVAETA